MSKYLDNCGGLNPPKPLPRRKDDKDPKKKSTSAPAKKKVKRK